MNEPSAISTGGKPVTTMEPLKHSSEDCHIISSACGYHAHDHGLSKWLQIKRTILQDKHTTWIFMKASQIGCLISKRART
eukprot:scaffold249391_cov37-Prasinocladus_malaysianus.AAC.1